MMRAYVVIGLVVLFVLSGDMLSLVLNIAKTESKGFDPHEALATQSSGHRVHIAGAFVQAAKLLQEHYPDLEISHSTYPLSMTKQRLILGSEALRFGALGVVVFSDQITATLGNVQMPPIWDNIRSNKLSSCVFVWFIGGTFAQNLQKTGAFEIYYNGDLVFSKLKENRLPRISEITTVIDSSIKESNELA